MKYFLAAILLPSLLFAQQPPPGGVVRRVQIGQGQPPGETLPDNYQITLTITDKDGQPVEVSLVAASTQFNASFGEQGLSLNGSLTIEESGSMVVAYQLGWNPRSINGVVQPSSNMNGTVRLKLGEDIQILRIGSLVARLSIKKLEVPKPK